MVVGNRRVICEAFFVLGSLLLLGETVRASKTAVIMPPPGNSLFMKTKIQNGRQMYSCSSKKWVRVGAAADLVKENNPTHRVGLFTSKFLQEHGKSQETWVLYNPVDDIVESGSNFSSVSGKEIASIPSKYAMSEALVQATHHQFDGLASLVSYVQQVFTKGGIPPLQETCDQDFIKVEVPYEAEYWFWRQDLQPPLSTPKSLSITSERVVEGLFGEGIVLYYFDSQSWEQIQIEASLYNVPGGILAGKYFWRKSESTTTSSHWWQLWNPTTFELKGRADRPAVSVARDCLPWSLITVTHHSGNVSLLGEYAHVQILSTRGGVPSFHPSFKPVSRMHWQAPFSAVFWFYTKLK